MQDDLTITLSLEDRKLLVYVLSDAIDHQPCERSVFNAMVQLRAVINGSLPMIPKGARQHDAA